MNTTLYFVLAGVFMAMGLSIGFTLGFMLGAKEKQKARNEHERSEDVH